MGNHVANGRAARDRRYEAAVRRQIALVNGTAATCKAPYAYEDAAYFLRPGDTVEMFTDDQAGDDR